MSNYDFVMPYDVRMEAWLNEQGYPAPRVSPQNRFPTKQEILEAVVSVGTLELQDSDADEFFVIKKGTKVGGGYQIRIGCSDWGALGSSDTGSITMNGYLVTELTLLEILSRDCGQLLLYPDTGAPAVIVQPGMDAEKISELWNDAYDRQDSWEYFYAGSGY
jgi:hypothetical protein